MYIRNRKSNGSENARIGLWAQGSPIAKRQTFVKIRNMVVLNLKNVDVLWYVSTTEAKHFYPCQHFVAGWIEWVVFIMFSLSFSSFLSFWKPTSVEVCLLYVRSIILWCLHNLETANKVSLLGVECCHKMFTLICYLLSFLEVNSFWWKKFSWSVSTRWDARFSNR